MIVTLLSRGLRIAGLQIGLQNAKRFLTPGATSIELQLDHVQILCPLPPRFWIDQSAILDPRLCLWLESKFHLRATNSAPPTLTLQPAGPNCFRLTHQPAATSRASERATAVSAPA